MKKLLIIAMVCLASFAADARSVKLGYGESSNASPTAVGNRPSGNFCTSSSICPQGFKCSSGKCVICQTGDADCNCPEGAEAIGTGKCGCAADKVSNGAKCVDICELTTCKAGSYKHLRGNQCCCAYEG